MENKNIDIMEIKKLAFTNIKNVIETSLQCSIEDLKKIIRFNMQEDYKYIITTESGLIDTKNVSLLLRYGYVLKTDYNNNIYFKHNNLIKKEEEEE